MAKNYVKLHTVKVEDGSQNMLFSPRLLQRTGIIKIGPRQSFWPKWKQLGRILRPAPDCSDTFAKCLVDLYHERDGQTFIADIRPEQASFAPGQYEATIAHLDNELGRPHSIAHKVAHPSKRMFWGDEEIIPYQYVYDIQDLARVSPLLRTSAGFLMLRFLILNQDADSVTVVEYLQSLFLGQVLDLDPVFKQIAYAAYHDFSGITFIVEASVERLKNVADHVAQIGGHRLGRK
jgi:hypothetical protein